MVKFIYPCEGKLTSPYGKDVLNGEVRSHFGIDLAQGGTVPIHAVADGHVSKSYLSTSYGECIRIVHYIGGVTYESLYAHMRPGSRRFHDGAKVKQGDVLGYMGETGYSFGQHLHFELHKGLWNIDKSNSVNPVDYLEKEGVKVAGKRDIPVRLMTGTFKNKEVAEKFAKELKKKYGWVVYIKEA
jgi:murein DD-endopeptidase MepM/ murein hydrolase activator NlpD